MALASRGLYTTSPNPRVGCVLVKDGQVVAEGWHERAGGAHAEVMALSRAQEKAKGSTCYITLEPCIHEGRTPPCAPELILAKVTRVVVAAQDPDPRVAGGGLSFLRQKGIHLTVGLLQEEARALNEGFFFRHERGRPFVRAKIGQSLDGRVALANGQSRWITCEEARVDAHHFRACSCAIMTGVGTVLADDPSFDVRHLRAGREPLRVVVDSSLRTPWNAKVARPGTIFASALPSRHPRAKALVDRGAQVWEVGGQGGQVDLPSLFSRLALLPVNEILLEAGPILLGACLQECLVDELLIYQAPKLLGDGARPMAVLGEVERLADTQAFFLLETTPLGQNIRLRARTSTCLPASSPISG